MTDTRAAFGLLFAGTIGITLAALETKLHQQPLAPGEAMRNTLRIALVGVVVAALLVGSTVGLIDGVWFDPPTGAFDGLSTGVGAGIFVGLKRGGRTYLHYQMIRWLQTRTGVTPPNLLGFLDLASRLGLMRRHGGGYAFVHALVHEHLAGIPTGLDASPRG